MKFLLTPPGKASVQRNVLGEILAEEIFFAYELEEIFFAYELTIVSYSPSSLRYQASVAAGKCKFRHREIFPNCEAAQRRSLERPRELQ